MLCKTNGNVIENYGSLLVFREQPRDFSHSREILPEMHKAEFRSGVLNVDLIFCR